MGCHPQKAKATGMGWHPQQGWAMGNHWVTGSPVAGTALLVTLRTGREEHASSLIHREHGSFARRRQQVPAAKRAPCKWGRGPDTSLRGSARAETGCCGGQMHLWSSPGFAACARPNLLHALERTCRLLRRRLRLGKGLAQPAVRSQHGCLRGLCGPFRVPRRPPPRFLHATRGTYRPTQIPGGQQQSHHGQPRQGRLSAHDGPSVRPGAPVVTAALCNLPSNVPGLNKPRREGRKS